jgi:succinyl-CoA synthetase beta subunit
MKIQSVSTIEKALAELAAKRESVVARSEVIAGERKVLGFISLVGNDKEATAKLAKLNVE